VPIRPARRRARAATTFVALALAVLSAAACSDDGGSGPPLSGRTLLGSYALVEVNGRTLPVSVRLTDPQTGASTTFTVGSGVLKLDDGGVYTLTLAVAEAAQQPVARADSGMYEETRNQLTFRSSRGTQGSGTWDGNDITLSIPVDLDGDGTADTTPQLLVSKSPGTLR
jgi:hypothetical protein